jgi:hypothetical protein
MGLGLGFALVAVACVACGFNSIFGIKRVAQQHGPGNAQNQAHVVVHLHAAIHAQPVGAVLLLLEMQHHPVAFGRQHVIKVVGAQRDGRHAAQHGRARHGCVPVVDAQQGCGQQQTQAEAAQVNVAPLPGYFGVCLPLVFRQGPHVVRYELGPVAHVGAVRHAGDQGGGNPAAGCAALHII